MDSVIKKIITLYDKYNKAFSLIIYLIMIYALYLNYQNLLVVNMVNKDILMIVMVVIGVLSIIKPIVGCVLLAIIYFIYVIPVNYILSFIYLLIAFGLMVGISYNKNDSTFVSIIYLLYACNSPLLLGITLTLYYVLCIQRGYGIPLIVSLLITCMSMCNGIFIKEKIFNLPLFEMCPENLYGYLYSFFCFRYYSTCFFGINETKHYKYKFYINY